MSKPIYPGWRMTVEQHGLYFRLLDSVNRTLGLRTSAEREAQRKLIHLQAFGAPMSAKDIDPLKDFDAFKTQCLAILKPSDLGAQLRQQAMPRTRLLYAIEQLARRISTSQVESAPLRSAYLGALMIDRYGHCDLDRITDLDELTKLRNTLADRLVEEHDPKTLARRNAKARQRRAAPQPEARINLPAPSPTDSLNSEEQFQDQVTFAPEPETADYPF
jgi:hypothetical protein